MSARLDSSSRALNAYVVLMRAAATLTNRLHGHLAKDGLTMAQFGVLEALQHLGPLQPNVLAEKLLCTPGNLTTVLDNLETRELVQRARESVDRRCVTVRLTDTGERLIRRVFPRHARGVVDAFAALTGTEQDNLRRLCRKLGLANAAAAKSAAGGTQERSVHS